MIIDKRIRKINCVKIRKYNDNNEKKENTVDYKVEGRDVFLHSWQTS